MNFKRTSESQKHSSNSVSTFAIQTETGAGTDHIFNGVVPTHRSLKSWLQVCFIQEQRTSLPFNSLKFPLNVYQLCLMDWEMFSKETGLKGKVICLNVKSVTNAPGI